MSNKTLFLRGSRIYLRPLERADLNETYLGWLNDPEVTRYLETGRFPTSQGDLEKFYEAVTGSAKDLILAIAECETNRHIGNVKLGPIDWIHRRATFGMLIGDKNFWGKGVGEEVTRLVVEYAFERLNLHRITLGVYEEHKSAVACYQKVGFKIEGCLREQVYHEGKYKNSLVMGLLRSEYKPEPGKEK